MLERRIRRLADRHVPGSGRVEIARLQDGLVNESFKITRDACPYVLRVSRPDAVELGIDRRFERSVIVSAAARGLAPALVSCSPEEGVLVTRWVDGKPWPAGSLQGADTLARAACLLRDIHSIQWPPATAQTTVGDWCERYTRIVEARGASLAELQPRELKGEADSRLRAYAALEPAAPRLCHSDLHSSNILACRGALLVLDWEFAHAGDPWWDIAGWICNQGLGADSSAVLITAYLGRPPGAAEHARAQLLVWLYDYVCWLWARLFAAIRGPAAMPELARRSQRLQFRLKCG